MKIKKGEHGYIDRMRRFTSLRTLALFLVAILIFAGGVFATGRKENLATVLAVLAVLPATKSLINTIMFFRFKGADEELYDSISSRGALSLCFFDCVFTLERGGSYPARCMCTDGERLTGLVDPGSEEILKKHIETLLRSGGIKDVNVCLFSKRDAFLNKLVTRIKDEERAQQVRELIAAITL